MVYTIKSHAILLQIKKCFLVNIYNFLQRMYKHNKKNHNIFNHKGCLFLCVFYISSMSAAAKKNNIEIHRLHLPTTIVRLFVYYKPNSVGVFFRCLSHSHHMLVSCYPCMTRTSGLAFAIFTVKGWSQLATIVKSSIPQTQKE